MDTVSFQDFDIYGFRIKENMRGFLLLLALGAVLAAARCPNSAIFFSPSLGVSLTFARLLGARLVCGASLPVRLG